MYRVGSFIDFDTDYGTPSMFKYFQTEEAQALKPDSGRTSGGPQWRDDGWKDEWMDFSTECWIA